jgi:hypothetical protein
MNISFKTKIRYNGKDFSSVDELPPGIRATYERALANRSDKLMSTGTKVVTRLVVNGHEVESTKELSEDEQKTYADAMQLLRVKSYASCGGGLNDNRSDTIPPGSVSPIASTQSAAMSSSGPSPQPAEIGWLTANQKKLVAIVAGLILLVAVIIALRAL